MATKTKGNGRGAKVQAAAADDAERAALEGLEDLARRATTRTAARAALAGNITIKDLGPPDAESDADEAYYRKAAEREARALRPSLPDRLRFWLMTSTECYELRRFGAGWTVTKYSDGRVYQLGRDRLGRLVCSCPGCGQYGPQCAGGRGCKHARMLKAVAGLLAEDGGPEHTPPDNAAAAIRMATVIVTGRDPEKAAA